MQKQDQPAVQFPTLAEILSSPPSSLFKPILIPQVTESCQGEAASPFMRAYSPILQEYHISKVEFLAFLDGLNEVFIVNPILQIIGIAGSVMGWIHPLEIVGTAVEAASEIGSGGMSYFRTRAYMKRANERMFKGKGLGVKIVGFDEAIGAVGVSVEEVKRALEIEKEDQFVDQEHSLDIDIGIIEKLIADVDITADDTQMNPRIFLLQILEGKVASLETKDLPVLPEQKNLLKRWNASFAAREGAKQTEKLVRKYHEAKQKRAESYREAINIARKKNEEIYSIQAKIEKTRKVYQMDEEKMYRKIACLTSEMDKVHQKKAKRMREAMKDGDSELQNLRRKELDKTMKVKWLIIFSLDETISRGECVEDSERSSSRASAV